MPLMCRMWRDAVRANLCVVKHTFIHISGASEGKYARSKTDSELIARLARCGPAVDEACAEWGSVDEAETRSEGARSGSGPCAASTPPSPEPRAEVPSSDAAAGRASRGAGDPSAGARERPQGAGAGVADQRTTVILRSLPSEYSRAALLATLDGEGFGGKYDFVYLPVSHNSKGGLGYATVNLAQPAFVADFWAAFDGFSRWSLPSENTCKVSWSAQFQGLSANVERYRSSAVMHQSIPKEHQPCILKDGVVSAFPRPTKALPVPPRSKRQ